MPIYEFKCERCWKTEERLLTGYVECADQKCLACGSKMKKLISKPYFAFFTDTYRPGIENKWNFNPKAAFSAKRGCGAEYCRRRAEKMERRSRYDLGSTAQNKMWPHHLKGTVKDLKRRRYANQQG